MAGRTLRRFAAIVLFGLALGAGPAALAQDCIDIDPPLSSVSVPSRFANGGDLRLLAGEGSCPMVDLDVGDYATAIRSDAIHNMFVTLLTEREERGLVSTEGVNQQIVEPRAATNAHRDGLGAGDWLDRISVENPPVQDGKSSCQFAVEEVKAVSCADTPDGSCDIERGYDERCVQSRSKRVMGGCVVAVDKYFASCFGTVRTSPTRPFIGALDDDSQDICSATLSYDDSREGPS